MHRHPRAPRIDPPEPEPSAILIATVDTVPERYEVVGLVEATMAVQAGVVPTAGLLDMLEREAVKMGADGVIGLRLSQVTLPGSSRERLLGGVIDHYGSTVVAVALGRRSAACQRSAPT